MIDMSYFCDTTITNKNTGKKLTISWGYEDIFYVQDKWPEVLFYGSFEDCKQWAEKVLLKECD